MRRLQSLQTFRAALWALRSVRRARRQLRTSGYEQLVLPPVPALPPAAGRGVNVVLRRLPSTCLERAMILQRWRAAQGEFHDVVVGVRGGRENFKAHAWLDDEHPSTEVGEFRELVRLKP